MLGKLAAASFVGSAFLLFGAVSESPAASKTIAKPMYNGNRLDWCARWSEDCGRPAADAYCKAQGFLWALSFEPDRHIGGRSPTRLIGTGATCDLAYCDGFRQITCLKQPMGNQSVAIQGDPSRAKLGLNGMLKSAGTRALRPVVVPIPIPRPVYVAAKVDQAEITELKAKPAVVTTTVDDKARIEAMPVVPAKIEPTTVSKDGAVVPEARPTAGQPVAAAVVEPANPAKAPKIFDKPMYNGKRLAWCQQFDADCGKPAADAFCRTNGFSAASEFSLDPHIGDVAPTRSIGSGAVCDQVPCDGFKLIACAM